MSPHIANCPVEINLDDMVRNYFYVCCDQRERLFDHLNRPSRLQNADEMKEGLLLAIDYMPARLAERVIAASQYW